MQATQSTSQAGERTQEITVEIWSTHNRHAINAGSAMDCGDIQYGSPWARISIYSISRYSSAQGEYFQIQSRAIGVHCIPNVRNLRINGVIMNLPAKGVYISRDTLKRAA